MHGSPGPNWEKRRTRELVELQLSIKYAQAHIQPLNVVKESIAGMSGDAMLGHIVAEYAANRERDNNRLGEQGFSLPKSLAILSCRLAEPRRVFAQCADRIAAYVVELLLQRKGWKTELSQDEWHECVANALVSADPARELESLILANWEPTGCVCPQVYRPIHEWAKAYPWYEKLVAILEG